MFSGEGLSFESWIKQVEGKFEEDNDTFASEKTRINFVITRLEGTAYKTVEGRHHSLTRPFTTLAELIQVLQTAHTNPNKGADARAQLRVCKYDWKKDFNIFLGEFNSMYEAAGYQPSMQKQTLWDSLPAPVNQAVVERVYDTKVRYEDFCNHEDRGEQAAPVSAATTNTATGKGKVCDPDSSSSESENE
ncbi:uncharacterized protein HRG_06155 [Hirsutella rhossiliensis]|uniref:Uncharacterized protein n=1 Tax=Hirsutella rhossiliensis TaxID=111463 RepID=A0A9P8MYL5_9HYPO|nr:uncharacterized protein HRG_06155 [Hirsutella rhossiliensis]KAH0963645.1 hypothetical protein HRG_06155 [Hirsutella rhossiliensis]